MLTLLQMLAALRNSPDSTSMTSLKDQLDPSLMDLYPSDCVFKVSYSLTICLSTLNQFKLRLIYIETG